MAENALVEQDIRRGEAIIRALDAADDVSMHPTAALWFLFPEEDAWRLLLALPARETDTPQSVYTRLLNTINRTPDVDVFQFDSVGLMSPDNPLVGLLGAAVQTPPDAIMGIRFTNSTVNGQFIPDSYIYRLTLPQAREVAAG
jgi:hypothetical protein